MKKIVATRLAVLCASIAMMACGSEHRVEEQVCATVGRAAMAVPSAVNRAVESARALDAESPTWGGDCLQVANTLDVLAWDLREGAGSLDLAGRLGAEGAPARELRASAGDAAQLARRPRSRLAAVRPSKARVAPASWLRPLGSLRNRKPWHG